MDDEDWLEMCGLDMSGGASSLSLTPAVDEVGVRENDLPVGSDVCIPWMTCCASFLPIDGCLGKEGSGMVAWWHGV